MSLTNKTFLDDAGLQKLWGKITDAIAASGGGGGSSTWWTLLNKTTTIDKQTGTITESNSDGTAVTTSTINGNVQTITTIITPTAGDSIFTQTTTITETETQKQIVEHYTVSPKIQGE